MTQLRTWFDEQQENLDRQDREGAVLGLLVLVLLVIIDFCYHGHGNLSASFVMAPVAAAALARPALVAMVGTCAFGASIGVMSYDTGGAGSLVKVSVVAVGSIVGVFTARHRMTLQARAVRLQSIADAAESALLRPLPGRVGPASLAGWHVAAAAEARVGGDFYEAVPYGSKVRWVIGDARGHGVEAIRLGAAVVGAFREAASRLDSLTEVVRRVDESVVGFLGEEDFVTAMFGELSHDGTLTLVNCGHPQPLRLGAREAMVLPVEPTTPLGLEPRLAASKFVLMSGDGVCFYTDGLDEVRPSRGNRVDALSLTQGLGSSSATDAAAAIRDRLRSQVRAVRLEDDVSVLVLKFLPLSDVNRTRLRSVSGHGDGSDRTVASTS
jgi:phosphoserine phosphatase RsbU/P